VIAQMITEEIDEDGPGFHGAMVLLSFSPR
jgi:hypothetical protein